MAENPLFRFLRKDRPLGLTKESKKSDFVRVLGEPTGIGGDVGPIVYFGDFQVGFESNADDSTVQYMGIFPGLSAPHIKVGELLGERFDRRNYRIGIFLNFLVFNHIGLRLWSRRWDSDDDRIIETENGDELCFFPPDGEEEKNQFDLVKLFFQQV
ncbi:MAG: hypothetical protein VYD64_07190 [Pseudomonadota bacterium]|nr:hypothetical protein [Pseudomonadota bacterium]